MSSSDLMVVTTTFDDREKALEVARLMVDAGLAVCSQVGDKLDSFYRWEGKVVQSSEVRVTFKVLGDRFELFCGELKLNHPYDVPQVVGWPAAYADKAYLDWAKGKGK
jgi:periplasmic divalent cation tolerance protein